MYSVISNEVVSHYTLWVVIVDYKSDRVLNCEMLTD